jgi:hypothetical protein
VGAFDMDSISHKSFQAPHISKHLKEWVEEGLDRGLTINSFNEEHQNLWFLELRLKEMNI